MVVCYCWIAHECCTTGSHISKEVKTKIKHLCLWWENCTTGMQAYSTYSYKLTWFTWAFLLSPSSSLANFKANQLCWDFPEVWRSEAQKRSSAANIFLEFSLLKRSAQTKEWKALLRSHLYSKLERSTLHLSIKLSPRNFLTELNSRRINYKISETTAKQQNIIKSTIIFH